MKREKEGVKKRNKKKILKRRQRKWHRMEALSAVVERKEYNDVIFRYGKIIKKKINNQLIKNK